jgi:hypothetical protein
MSFTKEQVIEAGKCVRDFIEEAAEFMSAYGSNSTQYADNSLSILRDHMNDISKEIKKLKNNKKDLVHIKTHTIKAPESEIIEEEKEDELSKHDIKIRRAVKKIRSFKLCQK